MDTSVMIPASITIAPPEPVGMPFFFKGISISYRNGKVYAKDSIPAQVVALHFNQTVTRKNDIRKVARSDTEIKKNTKQVESKGMNWVDWVGIAVTIAVATYFMTRKNITK